LSAWTALSWVQTARGAWRVAKVKALVVASLVIARVACAIGKERER
jgi:hypothetical protein